MSLADRCSEILAEIDASIGAPKKLPDGWVSVPVSDSVKAGNLGNAEESLDADGSATPKIHPNIFENIDAALSSFVIVKKVP